MGVKDLFTEAREKKFSAANKQLERMGKRYEMWGGRARGAEERKA